MVRQGSGPFMLVSSLDSTTVPLGLGCGELFVLESSQWRKSISERNRRRGDAGRVSASLFSLLILGANPFSVGGRSGARPLWFSAKSRPWLIWSTGRWRARFVGEVCLSSNPVQKLLTIVDLVQGRNPSLQLRDLLFQVETANTVWRVFECHGAEWLS